MLSNWDLLILLTNYYLLLYSKSRTLNIGDLGILIREDRLENFEAL